MSDGVIRSAPPAEFLEQTNHMIRDAVAQIGPGDHFLFVGVATETGTNLAAVQKLGEHVEIVEYIGKTWGKPISAGIAGVWHF